MQETALWGSCCYPAYSKFCGSGKAVAVVVGERLAPTELLNSVGCEVLLRVTNQQSWLIFAAAATA